MHTDTPTSPRRTIVDSRPACSSRHPPNWKTTVVGIPIEPLLALMLKQPRAHAHTPAHTHARALTLAYSRHPLKLRPVRETELHQNFKFQPAPPGVAGQGQHDNYAYAGTHSCDGQTVTNNPVVRETELHPNFKFQPVPPRVAGQGQQDSYAYAGTHS